MSCLGDTPNGKARGSHVCAFRDREQYPVIEETSLFCHFYDDMLAAVHLSVPGHHWTRREALMLLLPSTRLPRVVPTDPSTIGTSRRRRRKRYHKRVFCLVKIRYPTPDSLPHMITLAFGDLPSQVGGNYGYGCGWKRCFGLFQRLRSPRASSEIASYDTPRLQSNRRA